MEKKHVNVQHSRLVNSGYLRNCRGSEGRFHLSVILFFGVFSICLLVGLLVANVQYNNTKSQLTKDLEDLKKTHTSTVSEKNQLKHNLDNKSRELSMRLSKQNADSKCISNETIEKIQAERLHCHHLLINMTEGKKQLTAQLSLSEGSSFEGSSEHSDSNCLLDNEILSGNLTACLRDSEKLPFIRKEKELLTVKIGKTTQELLRLCNLSENKTCPEGWNISDCACYKISGSGSWEEGRASCLSEGGDLVVIEDQEEQEFLSTFKKEAWIGLSDRETEGVWLWVDGNPPNFMSWYTNQSDDGYGNPARGVENCGHVRHDGITWDHHFCNASKEWICEKIPTISAP